MNGLCLGELQKNVGGQLSLATLPPVGGLSEPLGRVVTRVADVQPGDVYWDVTNVRANGAVNAEEAFFRGAQGVITAGPHAEPWAGRFSLLVDDPGAALVHLIAALRRSFAGKVIAVGGGLGKSTTLHLIRTVLELAAPATEAAHELVDWDVRLANLLNGLVTRSDAVLVELVSEPGREIESQLDWLEPDVLVLPSAPEASNETGSAAAMQTGGTSSPLQRMVDLLDRLASDRHVVVNGDEELLRHAAAYTTSRSVTVGKSSHCDVIASQIECCDGRLSCQVEGQLLSAPLWGRHQVASILAAYAVGKILKRSVARIAEALSGAQPLPNRCEVIQTPKLTLINDTGSGRPATVGPALELLRDISAPGRRIVVCGELEPEPDVGPRACRQVGEAIVSRCGADWLITWGRQAGTIVHAARSAGLPAGRAVCCQDADDGRQRLASLLRDGDVVLVKGAPAASLQHLVQELTTQSEPEPWKALPSARDSRESRAALPPG